jgi:hypothetical protein
MNLMTVCAAAGFGLGVLAGCMTSGQPAAGTGAIAPAHEKMEERRDQRQDEPRDERPDSIQQHQPNPDNAQVRH